MTKTIATYVRDTRDDPSDWRRVDVRLSKLRALDPWWSPVDLAVAAAEQYVRRNRSRSWHARGVSNYDTSGAGLWQVHITNRHGDVMATMLVSLAHLSDAELGIVRSDR